MERCGALAVLTGHIAQPREHDHPTHHRRSVTAEERACRDEPGETDIDLPWYCEHAEWAVPVPAHLHDIGLETADKLLQLVPRARLDDRIGHYGPRLGTVLEALRSHSELRGHGRLDPPNPIQARIAIELLTIADPDLCTHEPDVTAGPLPAWTADLDADDFARYLTARQSCLDCSEDRRGWLLASQRYRLGHLDPLPRIDPYPAGTRDGVALLWW